MKEIGKAVILTALPVEYNAVRRHLSRIQEEVHKKGTVYERGTFRSCSNSWEIGIVEIGAGNEGAAAETERAISYFEPDVVIFVGIAGGLKDVKIGDVVVATKIYGYESGAAKETLEPRPSVGETSFKFEQRARAEARKTDWLSRRKEGLNNNSPRVFVGPIAAGEKVLKSTLSAITQFLRTNYGDALAVEMEGRGFLKAARASAIDAIVVRGISDLIDKKEEADSAGFQKIAAENAAAFVMEMLANFRSSKSINNFSFTEEEFWRRLTDLASKAYPKGPEEMSIWVRSGGDLSMLDLHSSGKEKWFLALEKLHLGGGGACINTSTLIKTMISDYPDNEALKLIVNHLEEYL
ncbi:MAG: hypothetical protein V2B20_06225 [Pseudomonadota bacterium]